MNIIDALKRKHEQQISERLQTLGDKKQLNTDVNPRLIEKLKKLAAEFSVPRYAITEHLLEIGHFYIARILKNPKKKEVLREHLIDKHMLNSGHDDPEELLRIGEGRYASELISMAKAVSSDGIVLEQVFADAKRTSNFDNVEKAKHKLLMSALILADWLSRHPLDEENGK
jgi:hypothetical protein